MKFLTQRASLALVIVLQPSERKHRRTDIRVVRPDIIVDPVVFNFRSRQAQPRRHNFLLDSAVVPGKPWALIDARGNGGAARRAAGYEEEVRVAEHDKRRRPQR